MTLTEVADMLESIGLPFAYDHFTKEDTPGEPPFICFTYPESNNFFADGKVYQKIKQLNIELYTDEKSFELEAVVENAMDMYELCYESQETYLDSEKMYMVRWETDVFITEDESADDNTDEDPNTDNG